MECAFEYFVALMVTDSFLAMLMRTIGMGEDLIVIVSSLVSLAFLFQFFAIFVVQKITNIKVFVIIFHSLSQLVFMSLYLIPFIAGNTQFKSVLTIAGILLAYFGNYFVHSMIFKWGNSYVHPTKRASYSATKEMISLMSGLIVTLGVGYVMGIFTNKDTQTLENGGLIFAAIAIFIFAVCDLVCLLLIKNDVKPKNEVKNQAPAREVIKNTFGNKNFVSVIILTIIFHIGVYTTVGSIGAYKLDLFNNIDPVRALFWIQLVNNAGVLARFAVSKPFGKYSDKHSFTKGIELGLLIGCVAFAINAFTMPSTWFLIIVFTVLYNVYQAATSANFSNIIYSYVDEKYFVQASAIKNSIGGVCGFGASLLAAQLVKAMEGGKEILGVTVYAPQILSAISCVLFLGAFVFTKLVLEKQKVIKA